MKKCASFYRSLAGAKCLKYSWLSASVVVVAQKYLRCFAAVEEAGVIMLYSAVKHTLQ